MGDLRDDLAVREAIKRAIRFGHGEDECEVCYQDVSLDHAADAVLAVLAGREAAAVAAVARARALADEWAAGGEVAAGARSRRIYARSADAVRRALDGAGDEPRPRWTCRICGQEGCASTHCPSCRRPHAEPAGDEPPTEPPWTCGNCGQKSNTNAGRCPRCNW